MIKRGQIRLVNLEPVRGAGANKTRPAVIVRDDAANAAAQRLGRGIVTVVPVTSNAHRLYPFQVRLSHARTGLPRDCKAQAEQVRSVAVARVGAHVGSVPPELMSEVDAALRIHLDL